MGVCGNLKNYSRGHDFNLDWKNNSPSVLYVHTIAKILGWNLETDVIAFVHDYGWDELKDGKWISHESYEPSDFECILDMVFVKERNESGWLTFDDELCQLNAVDPDTTKNMRYCLIVSSD